MSDLYGKLAAGKSRGMRMHVSRFASIMGRWAVGLSLALVLTTHAGAGDPVRVPGTGTALRPPEGFSPSNRFPGFEHARSQASIVVTEIAAPAADMMKGMTREALAAKGMDVRSSTAVNVDGRDGQLLEVAQSAAGAQYRKWMLVTGDHSTSVLVVGTFPQSAAADLSSRMRAAVLSATWARPERASDPFEGLAFRVDAAPGLKLGGRMGNMLLFNESGVLPSADPREALYVVGPSLGNPPAGDLRRFSETRAHQTAQLRDLRIISGRNMSVDGLPAYELLADAQDRRNATPIRLYQVIALDPGGYFIMQGLAGRDRAEAILPHFRSITQSFQRTGK